MPFKKKAKESEEVIADHPASDLKFVNTEVVAQLLKLPAYLPTEKQPYFDLLKDVRKTFNYAFVYNWLSVFRGCIKMQSYNFHVHIWEEELTGFSTPPTFLNTLKLQLVNALTPKIKIKYHEEFDDALLRILGSELSALLAEFGIEVSDYFDEHELLSKTENKVGVVENMYAEYDDNEDFVYEDPRKRGGRRREIDEEYHIPGTRKRRHVQTDDAIDEDANSEFYRQENEISENKASKIKFFDFLPISAKINIFYLLISKLNSMAIFQKYLEKFENQKDLRLDPLFKYQVGNKQFSYFLLDDNRLYLRTLTFNKKVKFPISDLSRFDPLRALDNIDPFFDWTCLTQNFYELYEVIQSFKRNSNLKKLSLSLSDMLDDFAAQEVKWKKNYHSRLREKNMQSLLLNRKRSSRLQQKEEKKRFEEVHRREEAERIIREAAAIRAAKRMKIKEDQEKERLQRLENRRHEISSIDNIGQDDDSQIGNQREEIKSMFTNEDSLVHITNTALGGVTHDDSQIGNQREEIKSVLTNEDSLVHINNTDLGGVTHVETQKEDNDAIISHPAVITEKNLPHHDNIV